MYSEGAKCAAGEKDPARTVKESQRTALYKKGAGANHRPRMDSRFAMSDDIVVVAHCLMLTIRQTESCGPLHDDGQEPCDRWM